MAKLICIIGVDGAGKTLLSKRLVSYFRRINVNSLYVYGRIKPYITYLLAILSRALLSASPESMEYREYVKVKKRAIDRFSSLTRIYALIMSFEYFLQVLLKVWLPLKLGYTVVCDRYLYDTGIYDLPSNNPGIIWRWITFMTKILPKPDYIFIIDIPEAISMSRKSDIPSIDYIVEKRRLFLYLSKIFNIPILDGTRENIFLVKEIANAVGFD
jgi:dTMP kinase